MKSVQAMAEPGPVPIATQEEVDRWRERIAKERELDLRVAEKAATVEPAEVEMDKVTLRGKEFEVGPDGKLYRRTEGFAVARVPVRVSDLKLLVGLGEVPERGMSVLYSVVEGWIPPLSFVRGVRDTLMKVTDGEAAAYMATRTVAGVRAWVAVVPKQEVSGGSWDADDLPGMYERWMKQGWMFVGHGHLHPAGMRVGSEPDLVEWRATPGVYLVMPRNDDRIGLYASTGGVVFHLGERVLPEVGSAVVVGERGEKKIKKLIAERGFKNIVVVKSRYVQGKGWKEYNKGEWDSSSEEDWRKKWAGTDGTRTWRKSSFWAGDVGYMVLRETKLVYADGELVLRGKIRKEPTLEKDVGQKWSVWNEALKTLGEVQQG